MQSSIGMFSSWSSAVMNQILINNKTKIFSSSCTFVCLISLYPILGKSDIDFDGLSTFRWNSIWVVFRIEISDEQHLIFGSKEMRDFIKLSTGNLKRFVLNLMRRCLRFVCGFSSSASRAYSKSISTNSFNLQFANCFNEKRLLGKLNFVKIS